MFLSFYDAGLDGVLVDIAQEGGEIGHVVDGLALEALLEEVAVATVLAVVVVDVAAGYAGDMDEELANELLDDIDYHFNKVKCRKIEMMMPKLMGMVESVCLNESGDKKGGS